MSARVVANKRISPSFIRVTIAGEELSTIAPMGADQWFRMFIPQVGQSELRLPSAASNLWYAQYLLMSKDTRPVVRNYTIRAYRAAGSGLFGETTEIDIDFAYHGDIGPASAWADTASAGDEVALLDEGCIYNPTPEAKWQLLVGDESALPAIIGILESAPADLRAEVFVEIPNIEDKQDIPELANVNVHWLVREDEHATPGVLTLETVPRRRTARGAVVHLCPPANRHSPPGCVGHLVNDRKFAKNRHHLHRLLAPRTFGSLTNAPNTTSGPGENSRATRRFYVRLCSVLLDHIAQTRQSCSHMLLRRTAQLRVHRLDDGLVAALDTLVRHLEEGIGKPRRRGALMKIGEAAFAGSREFPASTARALPRKAGRSAVTASGTMDGLTFLTAP